jgi:hypothetical protein
MILCVLRIFYTNALEGMNYRGWTFTILRTFETMLRRALAVLSHSQGYLAVHLLSTPRRADPKLAMFSEEKLHWILYQEFRSG